MGCLYLIYLLRTAMSIIFRPAWQKEGVGAHVRRIIGGKQIPSLDPFLMLDFFKLRLPAGFPDHPHRGFETVTYMLEGAFYHQDFKGHKGKINAGDLQWMSAGRGIMHSEMPASSMEDCLGFQLWINLQSKNKMMEPAYQEFTSDKIKTVTKGQADVKIISGKWEGEVGPIYARTPSYYFDVNLRQNGEFRLPIPANWNAIIFLYEGELIYQGKDKVTKDECCRLDQSKEEGDIQHTFSSGTGTKFILVGGQPLKEPIAKYGPFVMNSQEEIAQTIKDYQQGKNGFENANQWNSKIREMAKGKTFEEL